MLSFIDKLKTNISDKNSNLCVGIDIDKKYFNDNVSLDEMMDYSMMIVDATNDLAAAYKPNLAFFEEWGSKGYYWLENLMKHIGNEHVVIADAKRGDIGNTGLHYANAFFNHLNCDAITVSPYMGEESIEPFISNPSKGAYVLCRTSNKSSTFIQEEIYSKVKLFLVNNNFQLAKFIKKNMSGKKIVIGMGAGTISNWMRELPKLI